MPTGRQLRVLLACDWFVRYTTGLARGIQENDCRPLLLTRSHDMEFGDEPGAMRDWVAQAFPDLAHEQLTGRVREPAALAELWRLRSRLRGFEADVVHLQESVANDPRLAIAAGVRPRRYALTVHDVERHPGDRQRSRTRQRLFESLIRHAGLLFVHAEPIREALERSYGPRAPVEVVPLGIDESPVAPLPRVPTLLFFGRISHYKGLDTLLDAMPEVWRRLPAARLMIAGEGEIEPHHALADERVMVDNGFIPDDRLDDVFAQATCVVLPYREASQSMVASLAKRHGRAVVATDVGGLPATATDGSTALVPPERPHALADAIVETVGTPGRAEEMGRRGAASVRVNFGWQSVARVTLEAYERHLLAPRRR